MRWDQCKMSELVYNPNGNDPEQRRNVNLISASPGIYRLADRIACRMQQGINFNTR